MAEIVNLRLARKAKKRGEDAAKADSNRARHGQTIAQRRTVEGEADRLARTLAGAKRTID